MTANEVCTMIETNAGDRLSPEQAIDVGRVLLFIDANIGWLSNNAKTLLMADVIEAAIDADLFDYNQAWNHAAGSI